MKNKNIYGDFFSFFGKDDKEVSNLAFYAQSTSTAISGRRRQRKKTKNERKKAEGRGDHSQLASALRWYPGLSARNDEVDDRFASASWVWAGP